MFAENFRKFRKQNCYTQKDMAIMLNVCRSTVSAWENYVSEPDIKTIIKIKHIFNVTYDELLES